MRVKYPVITHITIDKDCKFKIDYSIGEIAGFIPGDDSTPDRFLIADDASGAFIKVNVSECFKID